MATRVHTDDAFKAKELPLLPVSFTQQIIRHENLMQILIEHHYRRNAIMKRIILLMERGKSEVLRRSSESKEGQLWLETIKLDMVCFIEKHIIGGTKFDLGAILVRIM